MEHLSDTGRSEAEAR